MVIELYEQRRLSLARKHKERLPCYREVCQVLHLATCKGRRAIHQEYREIDFLHTCSNRRVTARKLGLRKAWIQAFTIHKYSFSVHERVMQTRICRKNSHTASAYKSIPDAR